MIYIINIVLLEPEIPANTGNIGRSCVATGARLHLIKPLGFDTSDKAVKKSGLDYWHRLDVTEYENIEDFFEKNKDGNFYFATTKSEKTYADVTYKSPAYIIFGKESAGLPEELILKNPDTSVRIPMVETARSLNLSNAAAIILYEALRQNNFNELLSESPYFKGE